MRRIAIVNQKGGVGKTTTVANLGAALALRGARVLVVDLDPQGNLSMHLGLDVASGEPSTYGVLLGDCSIADGVRPTSVSGLEVLPANIDLSGAELELAGAIGREGLLGEALERWEAELAEKGESAPDFVLFDCPPSLGLLSINGLVAASEVFIALQTEFFALQGMSKLVDIVGLLQKRLNPDLRITGIVPCLFDSRLRLAREVLAEIRKYFGAQVFRTTVGTNVKLAEAPSHALTIHEYAPGSTGARDYTRLADEVLAQFAPEPPVPPAGAESEGGETGAGAAEGSATEREASDPPATGVPRPIVRAEDLPRPPARVFPSR